MKLKYFHLRHPFFLFLLFALTLNTKAQNRPVSNHIDTSIISAYHLLFDLKYNQIRNSLDNKYNSKSVSFYNPYYLFITDFVEYLSIGDEDLYNRIVNTYSRKIDELDEYNNKTDAFYAVKSEMYLFYAALKFTHSDYFASSVNVYKSYFYSKKALKVNPKGYAVLKVRGIFQIVLASVPEEFAWILDLAGLKGNIQTGIKYLKQFNIYEKSVYGSSIFGKLILCTIQEKVLNEPNQAMIYVNQIQKTTVSLFYEAKLNRKIGKNDTAIILFQELNDSGNAKRIPISYYWYASSKLNRLDTNAVHYMLQYLKDYKGDFYRRSAYLRLCWYYTLFNNPDSIEFYKNAFYKSNTSISDIDIQAESEMKILPSVHHDLLKSRLLFDGGYYDKSLLVINSLDTSSFTNKKHKVEYLYRYARLFHKLNNSKKAVLFYLKCIDESKNMKYYFAPFSALQLAKIYEQKQQPQNALFYYKLSLKLNKGEYKNSIEYQAKAGINQLSN